MAKLPKSIIKKYGISKKAWSVFRASKKNKSQTRGVSMAKKKTVKRRLGKKGSAASINNVLKIATGAGIVALYEVFVSPRIPLNRDMKNILELVIGLFLLVQRNVYMKSAGVALVTINTFEILVPLIRGMRSSKKAVSSNSVDAMLQ